MSMLATFRAFLKSPFFKQNAVFFIGSLLVGAFNYIYYPILARMLEPEAYGEVQTIVAIFTQLLVFLNVLSQVSVSVVANYTDEDRKQRIIFELEKLAFMVSLGLLVAGSCLSWYAKDFFHFETAWPFVLLLGALLVTVPPSFRIAFLRAHQRFGMASIATIIGAAGKVLLSALLVWLGFKTLGAIAGILIAQIISFGYAAYKAKQLGLTKPAGVRYLGKPSIKEVRPELGYAGFVFICSMVTMLLTTIDIFVVKHYFDPAMAGQYAGISTVARIIFYLTAPLSQVLLPAVKIANSARQNRLLLLKSLGLVTLIGGSITLFFMLFSTFSIHVLIGGTYLQYASLLPLLSLAMFFLSVVNLVISYYIALRKYQLLGIIVPGICMAVVVMWGSHSSLKAIVVNMLISNSFILLLCVLWRSMHLINMWRSNVRRKNDLGYRSRTQ